MITTPILCAVAFVVGWALGPSPKAKFQQDQRALDRAYRQGIDDALALIRRNERDCPKGVVGCNCNQYPLASELSPAEDYEPITTSEASALCNQPRFGEPIENGE